MNKIIDFFKDIYSIFIRELHKISHDTNLFAMFLLAPLVYPFMYGGIYMNKIEENVQIGFIDYDNSALSRQLLRSIDANQEIYLKYRLSDINEAKDMLIHDKIQGLIIIPNSFSFDLKRGKQTNVDCLLPTGRLLVTSDIGFAVSGIVSTFGTQIAASFLAKQGTPVFSNSGTARPIATEFQYQYNPYVTYGDLLLPAIMITIFSQLLFIGVGASTAHEYTLDKWKGVFETSHNYLAILIGKLATYTGLFIFFSLFTFSITCQVYDIKISTNFSQYFWCVILGINASAALGMLLGTFFRRKVTAFVLLGFMTYPFFFMTGYAWPHMQMTPAMIAFSNIFPLTPFLDSLFKITQMEQPFTSASGSIIIMILQIIVYGSLAMVRMRRLRLDKQPKHFLGQYWSSLPR